MSSPSRKRLRQSTIFQGFKKQKSIPKDSNQEGESSETTTTIDLTADVDMATPADGSGTSAAKEISLGASRVDQAMAAAEGIKSQPQKDKDNENSETVLTSNNDQGAEGTADKPVALGKEASFSGGSTTEPDSQPDRAWDDSMELYSDGESQPAMPKNGAISLGTPIRELQTSPSCSLPLPDLQHSRLHTVLINTRKLTVDQVPQPYPKTLHDVWDGNHVRMPCSEQNLYPVGNKTKKRWYMIEQALKRPIMDSAALERTILDYNSRQTDSWNFATLHQYFLQETTEEEETYFFKTVLPKMADLALSLPNICTGPIPLLRQGQPHKITLSQKQIACLLANAFFCTFPRRNTKKRQGEYSSFPDINFNVLFMDGFDRQEQKLQKMKCIIHYFCEITKKMPTGLLTFKRQLVNDYPKWKSSHAMLTRLHMSSNGTIEDEGEGMLQVDFANKFLGGGVLGRGCVQEEIRFLVCPELIVSRLFTECLDDNECLIMTGCQRFSNYSGYAASFKWTEAFEDPTPSDAWCRRCTEIVAIDALMFRGNENQFRDFYVKRELGKAYCGFCYIPESDACKDEELKRKSTPAVATGNWGCGAFGGDVQLKALIQLIAAAETGRDVCYFTFNDARFVKELYNMHKFITESKMVVGDIYQLIREYFKSYYSLSHERSLFDFIYSKKGVSPGAGEGEENNCEGFGGESPDYQANTP